MSYSSWEATFAEVDLPRSLLSLTQAKVTDRFSKYKRISCEEALLVAPIEVERSETERFVESYRLPVALSCNRAEWVFCLVKGFY